MISEINNPNKDNKNKKNINVPSDIYIRQMNEILSLKENPKVMLHACCAPCSSFCLLTLRGYADIGVYFYNPNITSEDEYELRFAEEKRLIDIYNNRPDYMLKEDCRQVNIKGFDYVNHNIKVFDVPYESDIYLEAVRGYEKCLERGERCSICFDLRLRKTAKEAKRLGYDYFATTLTLSPLKNADIINAIGEKIAGEVDIKYLPTDFKKKNGYKTSIELSKEFNLYRQNFCGCAFSKH